MKTVTLHTTGDGLWSATAREVEVTNLVIDYVNDELDFGELRVYFNTDKWNVYKDGLIYTDELFMKELRALCDSLHLAGDDVQYSEQGMQGDDYVSCDVEGRFLNSWIAVHGEGCLAGVLA